MNKLIITLGATALFGLLAITPKLTYGQVPVETSTTTTTTSTGTVSEFTPNAMEVRVDATSTPMRYTFTKTTTYVDENGNPVSVETVKSGVPVVVYYERTNGGLVADKVVVKKMVTTTAAAPNPPVTAVEPNMPPSANGFITEADSDDISIRAESSTAPTHYQAHDSTAYVDQAGNPVPKSSLKAGTPVTIFFERDGDHFRATRVVVNSSAAIEKQTTTTTQQTTVPQ